MKTQREVKAKIGSLREEEKTITSQMKKFKKHQVWERETSGLRLSGISMELETLKWVLSKN